MLSLRLRACDPGYASSMPWVLQRTAARAVPQGDIYLMKCFQGEGAGAWEGERKARLDSQSHPGVPASASAGRCVVVVPCYNEALRLKPELFSAFVERQKQVEFLFVNDGSSDDTLALLAKLRERDPERIHVLDKQPNAGKADALRVGMLHAIQLEGVAVTGFWDADLATPLRVIPDFLSKLEEEPAVEMVFGSCVRLLGHAIHRKPVRHYLGRCFATVVSLMLQMPVYDTQCGAKLFRVTPDLGKVLATPFQSKWIFDVEIIARFVALRGGDPQFASLAIYESPLPQWEDVGGSKVSPSDFLVAFWDLLKIRSAKREIMMSMLPSRVSQEASMPKWGAW